MGCSQQEGHPGTAHHEAVALPQPALPFMPSTLEMGGGNRYSVLVILQPGKLRQEGVFEVQCCSVLYTEFVTDASPSCSSLKVTLLPVALSPRAWRNF